jgi:hypothetical protein
VGRGGNAARRVRIAPQALARVSGGRIARVSPD